MNVFFTVHALPFFGNQLQSSILPARLWKGLYHLFLLALSSKVSLSLGCPISKTEL